MAQSDWSKFLAIKSGLQGISGSGAHFVKSVYFDDTRWSTVKFVLTLLLLSTWLDEEKEAKPRPRPRPDHSELDFSSLLVVSTDTWGKATMLIVLEAELQSTWLQSWNTCPLRSSSWLETQPVTTRSPGSSPDICSWLSETTRSWTSFLLESPSLMVVYFPTSKLSCCPRRTTARKWNPKCFLGCITSITTVFFKTTHILKKQKNIVELFTLYLCNEGKASIFCERALL